MEEFWGGAPHTIPLREIFWWQEGLPAYSFNPGAVVEVVDSDLGSVGAAEPAGAGTGTGAALARLLRRELGDDRRKAWRIELLAGGDQGQGERVVPLERLRLAPASEEGAASP